MANIPRLLRGALRGRVVTPLCGGGGGRERSRCSSPGVEDNNSPACLSARRPLMRTYASAYMFIKSLRRIALAPETIKRTGTGLQEYTLTHRCVETPLVNNAALLIRARREDQTDYLTPPRLRTSARRRPPAGPRDLCSPLGTTRCCRITLTFSRCFYPK